MAAKSNKSFTHTYKYERETKGTWVYTLSLTDGERVSGTNAVYLLKSEYKTKPGDTLTVTYEVNA